MTSLKLSLLLCGSLSLASCAIPTKAVDVSPSIARDLPPVAIASAIAALDDPANQLWIEQMLASPGVRDLERELARGFVDASVSALSDDARLERIAALTSRYATVIIAGLVEDALPRMAAALGQTVRSTLGEQGSLAAREGVQADLAHAVARELGPALEMVLADNVGPGLARALEKEDVRRALGRTARMLGREVILGVDEGMAEIQSKKPQSEPTVLGSVGALAEQGADLAGGVTWVLAAIVVVLGGLLFKLLMQARKYRSETAQREAATRVLEQARPASAEKPPSAELIGALGVQPPAPLAGVQVPHIAPTHSQTPPTNGAGRG